MAYSVMRRVRAIFPLSNYFKIIYHLSSIISHLSSNLRMLSYNVTIAFKPTGGYTGGLKATPPVQCPR